ncbi:hypothetical protein BROSI_A1356 [Candidatus Brocadia sinica JPN1]|uniref:Uncharacterized protein n=1 Tax=Candidatus Brocadia sinica JPN1 TaxID=1197129 RepID=A0ABQ0JVW8_9BACT|nr:hypothetical protein BROSI_A1356 [Candidatus Brocadia sinica JPN1]GIK13636.1 MAG: hypothetical protein BroJett002_23430 [Candidatus Brocadia sinica]GJQ16591.1 MAG: hypothetical protein HBSIN01_05500 [Candidatus Brocadia sinica]
MRKYAEQYELSKIQAIIAIWRNHESWIKKNTAPTNKAVRQIYLSSVTIRKSHGIKAIHARYPRSAGGKERHKKRMVRRERMRIFTKFVLLKVLETAKGII